METISVCRVQDFQKPFPEFVETEVRFPSGENFYQVFQCFYWDVVSLSAQISLTGRVEAAS